jgi:hypothetical protein
MKKIQRREKTKPGSDHDNAGDFDFIEQGWVLDHTDAPNLTDRHSLAETLGRSMSDAMAMLRGGD